MRGGGGARRAKAFATYDRPVGRPAEWERMRAVSVCFATGARAVGVKCDMELQGGTYRECRGYAAGQCLNFVVNGFLSVKVYRGYRGGDAGFFGKGGRGKAVF